MANSDWYPKRLTDLIPWHANFAVEAAATGATLNLTAGALAQIPIDRDNVALVVNYVDAVNSFAQEATAFRDNVLRGNQLGPMPVAPVAPATLVPAVGSLPGIEARTRDYAARIKAAAAYTPALGEAYGIVGTASPYGTPTVSASSQIGSEVKLKIGKAGYLVLVVDSRRNGGAWEQIGISQTAVFLDTRAPLVAGQPEQREYRVQGMVQNARDGSPSDTVSIVTTP
jgi:hypothetical protein